MPVTGHATATLLHGVTAPDKKWTLIAPRTP